MKTNRVLTFFAALLIMTLTASAKKITRVACIGNSITYGAGVAGREHNSYPAQLGAMLGSQYEIANFGVSATTLLSNGNYPYITTAEYKAALESAPDIVFIKLGTNDSKMGNREKIASDFELDLGAMVDTFRGLPSKPRVILLTPVRAFTQDTSSIHQISIERDVVPRIKNVARDKKVEIIDLQDLFTNYDQSEIGDGVHPTSIGAGRIAVRLYQYLTGAKMMTTVAAPGNEFRSGAGWCEGADWMANHREISSLAGQGPVELLLIGNSITQGFGGEREVVTYKPGKAYMDSLMAGRRWVSAGISGDRTQNVLWRLQNGNYEAGNPRYIVLMIGVNNIVAGGNTGVETAQGILACVREIRKRMPDSKLIVLGTLPAGLEPTERSRVECAAEHAVLAKDMPRGKNMRYVNPTEWFVNPADGKLLTEYYGGDMLHLSGEGYKHWCGIIGKLIEEME